MEIDPQDVGVISQGLRRNNASDDDLGNLSCSQSDLSSNKSEASHPVAESSDSPYHVTKWKRLRKQFNDQYLDFFNNFCNNETIAKNPHDLLDSQHGAVVWTSEEKESLFAAMDKTGLHDLPRLSAAVTTKSPVEIRAYINTVHAAHIERQLFIAHPKNASRADVPAAAEVGHACETALESAANALSAYQEQYDITAGQEQHGRFWLIDRDAAVQLDARNDNTQARSDDDTEETGRCLEKHPRTNSDERIHRFFNLSNMLDLSEQFFMNQSPKSPYLHWKSISEPDQRPAMTQDTLETLLQLVMDRLREVIRITLHVANARLSLMASDGYEPKQSLGRSDVATALNILHHSHDSWDFWTGLARRNQFDVVTGSHSKGESRMEIVSHDGVEAALATRRNRGRRRSMSISSETSSIPSDVSEDAGTLSGFGDNVVDESSEALSEVEDAVGTCEDQVDHVPLKRTGSASFGTAESSDASDIHDARSTVSRGERRVLLDKALEEYMEKADKVAQNEEETRLWQILGKRTHADIEDMHKLEPRPKTIRKTQEELRGWSCIYMAEWEHPASPNMLVEDPPTVQSKETDPEHSEGTSQTV